MPNSITHYLFAMDCLDNLQIKSVKDIISKNMDLYILGCQGPNFFTYYSYMPIISKNNIGNMSELIHRRNINIFLKRMLSYSTNNSYIKHIFDDSNFHEITMSYIYGFLSHYILDRSMHPYIYSLQFNLRDQYKLKSPRLLHKSIETHIDSLLLNKFKNLKPSQFNKHTDINLSKDELIIICDMYKFLLKSVFNKSILYDDVIKCIETFKKTEQLLNSRGNFYSRFYLLMKKRLSKNSYIDGKIYSEHKYCVNDLLNENKNTWENPFDNTKSSCSLLEIYDNSIGSYLKLIETLDLYLSNKKSMIELLLEFNDRSFLTDQDWNIKYINI